MANNDYAVVVGINNYPDSSLDSLEGPENDAKAFREWLMSPDGGNVPNNNIAIILSSDFPDGKPTTDDIDHVIEEKFFSNNDFIGDCVSKVGRRLYIFMAGHGITPRAFHQSMGEVALLAANAGRLKMGHHIAGKSYSGWVINAALFEEVVLLMDCCRDRYDRAPLRNPPWDIIECSEGRNVRLFTGFSTQWTKKANEGEIHGIVRGYFSTAVLEGLRNATDEKGRITASSLRDFVFNYMSELVADSEYQEPEMNFDLRSAGDRGIIFRKGAETRRTPVVISFRELDPQMTTLVLDGDDFEVVESREQGAGDWEIQLESGKKYLIYVPDGEVSKPIDVIGEEVIHVSL